jgi:TetR/AcrR family transcriptional repressor of bet genes
MPKIVDHEERRQEIARATVDLISEKGIDSLKLTDIADALGCTTGVVTHYFNSKEEILIDAARLANQNLVDRSGARFEIDPDDFLGAAIEALPLDQHRLTEWRTWLSFWGEAVTDSELGMEIQSQFSAWTSSTERIIEDGIKRGVLRNDLNPVHETDRWHALLDGIGLQAALNPDDWPPERQIRPLREYFEGLLAK